MSSEMSTDFKLPWKRNALARVCRCQCPHSAIVPLYCVKEMQITKDIWYRSSNTLFFGLFALRFHSNTSASVTWISQYPSCSSLLVCLVVCVCTGVAQLRLLETLHQCPGCCYLFR